MAEMAEMVQWDLSVHLVPQGLRVQQVLQVFQALQEEMEETA